MFTPDQYELIDFGQGRKLERFGDLVLDRPSPAAEGSIPRHVEGWRQAHAQYRRTHGDRGKWRSARPLPEQWAIRHGSCEFRLRPTPFGHVGVFPEQAVNWDWIARQIRRAHGPLKILNLFAYTGGSSLAAAAAGGRTQFDTEIVHVDAAQNIVRWARQNAAASGLAQANIRWIVEDAAKFVRRELRRGNTYDAVILDPPSYGHGPHGETWKLEDDLLRLLKDCAALTADRHQFLLLSCHSPGFGPAEAEAYLAEAVFGHCGAGVQARKLSLPTSDGRRLNAGLVARWP